MNKINIEKQINELAAELLRESSDDILILAKHFGITNKSRNTQCFKIAKTLIDNQMKPGKCIQYTKDRSHQEINTLREKVFAKHLMFRDRVVDMTADDLKNLFNSYDELFFEGRITKHLAAEKFSLEFKTQGTRTFQTDGFCFNAVCNYIITIPTAVFENVKAITLVAGHPCHNQLECLLRVMEHEIVHLLIFSTCYDQGVSDQHAAFFMKMVSDLFGHTDHRHQIF
jgi:hypothetical protein